MTVSRPGVRLDITLTDSEWRLFAEIVEDVAIDASIDRLTPSLYDIEFSPVFRYNPVFLRELPIQGRADRTLAKLVAATEAMLTHTMLGLNTVRTMRIARIAGVSIGTFYRYFEDEIAILDYVFPERIVNLPQGS